MICTALFVVGLSASPAPEPVPIQTAEILVAPSQSLQAAIEACPPGSVIRLVAGVYSERITIEKPITLVGAGWDKTVIGPAGAKPPAPKETRDARDAGSVRAPRVLLEPTLLVRNTRDVELRGLRVRGPDSAADKGTLTEEALVVFDSAAVAVSECAGVGPSMNGISIRGASDVHLDHSLVAALWGTGVQASGDKATGGTGGSSARARVEISDCDIRNCYHRCVTIGSDDVVVERCLISGSAWHGIRYDGCSPTIRANQIFGNARSGIYASGETNAKVTGNVFWKNEMSGVSCWFKNADVIEGNTFVGNLREAIAVLGGSRPKISKNVFADNPIAVFANKIGGDADPGALVPSELAIVANFFWANPIGLKIADQTLPLPSGNELVDPGFVDAAAQKFALAPDAAARRASAGAADPILLASPFPIQPEEKAIVPDTDKRDFQLWKR
jgi:hypothetical protein